VQLETERLLLRLPERDDLDGYAVFFADPEVVRFTSGVTANRAETARGIERMLRHWDEHDIGLFSVVRKEDERLVGRAGFLLWDAETWVNAMRQAPGGRIETELGWTLGREFWGRGYATEAARAARDWALAERGLPRLISLIQRGNWRSVRVAEKLGEILEREELPGPFPATTDLYALRAGNGPAR
jgi:RimJ/RimL family protein N-acetyltransferase